MSEEVHIKNMQEDDVAMEPHFDDFMRR